MSKMTVGTVMGRAVTDVDFRERLSVQPAELLEGFDLSMAEIKALRNLDWVVFEEFVENLTKCNKKDDTKIG